MAEKLTKAEAAKLRAVRAKPYQLREGVTGRNLIIRGLLQRTARGPIITDAGRAALANL